MKKVAVIGAGVTGLIAAKHLTEENSGFECCVFEQADSVGGTWVYSDYVGKDEYGLPVHSSMYRSLRTNLPKEIMQLPDFPHRYPTDRSFLTSAEVLKYFEDFARHFNLYRYIKFRHVIKRISPIEGGSWRIELTDLKNRKELVYHFDAVILCVGIYSTPSYPSYKGIEKFKGFQMHSHNYRAPQIFEGMKVLVIGSGPSGLDITFQVSSCAEKVMLSHHNTRLSEVKFPNNVIQKPDIREVTESGVIFEDGTYTNLDTIVYCTGYTYSYPFLDEQCGITLKSSMVEPLYRHFINIKYPSMCFIGVPRELPGFTMFDMQVRCFLKILKGSAKLPSTEEMLQSTAEEVEERERNGQSGKQFHMMKETYAKRYFDHLAALGNFETIKPVILDIYFSGKDRSMKDFTNFRNKKYTLIDSENYVVES